jgi:hypothetical protein
MNSTELHASSFYRLFAATIARTLSLSACAVSYRANGQAVHLATQFIDEPDRAFPQVRKAESSLRL